MRKAFPVILFIFLSISAITADTVEDVKVALTLGEGSSEYNKMLQVWFSGEPAANGFASSPDDSPIADNTAYLMVNAENGHIALSDSLYISVKSVGYPGVDLSLSTDGPLKNATDATATQTLDWTASVSGVGQTATAKSAGSVSGTLSDITGGSAGVFVTSWPLSIAVDSSLTDGMSGEYSGMLRVVVSPQE